MIDEILYTHIKTSLSVPNLYYGGADGVTPPYYIMFKVSDNEEKAVLCDGRNEAGEALLQFTGWVGGEGVASSASKTLVYVEGLKIKVKGIMGDIGTTPNDYRIWANDTTGVRIISEGENILQRWGAIFETTIRWEKI